MEKDSLKNLCLDSMEDGADMALSSLIKTINTAKGKAGDVSMSLSEFSALVEDFKVEYKKIIVDSLR